jgi:hypothetical protein
MSHSIANLEHHHFKYPQFRRPGDAHCHFFGTATLSFADGVKRYPVTSSRSRRKGLGLPLANPPGGRGGRLATGGSLAMTLSQGLGSIPPIG